MLDNLREAGELLLFWIIATCLLPVILVAIILGRDRHLAAWLHNLIPDSWKDNV